MGEEVIFPNAMEGVREYGEEMPVELHEHTENETFTWKRIKGYGTRWVITAHNEAGFNSTSVDLLDLLAWLRKNRPDLLELPND